MNIGLTESQISDILGKTGIRSGEGISASGLQEAIAAVVVKNNEVMTKNIKESFKQAFTEHDHHMHGRLSDWFFALRLLGLVNFGGLPGSPFLFTFEKSDLILLLFYRCRTLPCAASHNWQDFVNP